MDKIKLAREIAKRAPARFIEIDPREGRVYRHTAYENRMKERKAEWNTKTTECLEAEFKRVWKQWHGKDV